MSRHRSKEREKGGRRMRRRGNPSPSHSTSYSPYLSSVTFSSVKIVVTFLMKITKFSLLIIVIL